MNKNICVNCKWFVDKPSAIRRRLAPLIMCNHPNVLKPLNPDKVDLITGRIIFKMDSSPQFQRMSKEMHFAHPHELDKVKMYIEATNNANTIREKAASIPIQIEQALEKVKSKAPQKAANKTTTQKAAKKK